MDSLPILPDAARAACLWTAVMLLLLLVLSSHVVRLRRRHGVAFGDGGVEALRLAQRTFANAVEYVPAAMGALAVLVLAGASAGVIHIAGLLLLAARLLHAFALSRSAEAGAIRAWGVTATWGVYVFLIACLLFYALG